MQCGVQYVQRPTTTKVVEQELQNRFDHSSPFRAWGCICYSIPWVVTHGYLHLTGFTRFWALENNARKKSNSLGIAPRVSRIPIRDLLPWRRDLLPAIYSRRIGIRRTQPVR
jgi:hypothetical protein